MTPRTTTVARAAASSLALVVMTIASLARADRITDAEDLFRRAKALMAQNKTEEACPLLGESYRLDPGMGTLLNLALCHEQIGKISSAWGEFRAVEQQARAATPPNESRATLARQHADKLEPRLSRIKIVVPEGARVPGLVVKLDGDEKAAPLWSGVPVDPGTRLLEASAPGKKPRVVKVKVDDEGVLQTITLAPLEDAPATAAKNGSGGSNLDELEEYAAARARRTTGFVVGGIGLATVGAGVAFAILAVSANGDAQDACPQPCRFPTNEADTSNKETDRALTFANIANVTIPLGLVGMAVATYLVLSAGPTKRAALGPSLSARSLGIGGSW